MSACDGIFRRRRDIERTSAAIVCAIDTNYRGKVPRVLAAVSEMIDTLKIRSGMRRIKWFLGSAAFVFQFNLFKPAECLQRKHNGVAACERGSIATRGKKATSMPIWARAPRRCMKLHGR